LTNILRKDKRLAALATTTPWLKRILQKKYHIIVRVFGLVVVFIIKGVETLTIQKFEK